jgi:glycopeptide antibiotics resistance protein
MTPRQRFLAARAAYVAVVLLATLTDLHLTWDLAAAGPRLVRAFEPSLGWRDAVDGLRNVALFAGLGAVWVVTSLSGKVRSEIRRATLTGFALSATVEGLQVFSPERTASVVDLATNTLGALAGALALALLIAGVQRAKGARSYLGVPAFALAGAYGLAVLCEALTPLFRNDLLPSVAGGPLGSLRLALGLSTPLSLGAVPLLDSLLFAPEGFLAMMALAERSRDAGATWPRIAALMAGLAVAAEFAHVFIRLPIRWEAAAVHALALGFGAWAAWRWLPGLTRALRGPARARTALAAYAALLVLWGWRPLLPELRGAAIAAQLEPSHFVPLLALAGRVDVFSAVHVAQQFLLYVPLGCLLAVWPLRLAGRWSHLWPALWLTLAIEAGHIVIAERFFDVTNALIALAGLGIGWVTVRRSGFRPYGAALPAGR